MSHYDIAGGALRFSVCEVASGASGFYGEGYPYHRYARLIGLTHKGCGHVSKSICMQSRLGPERGGGNTPMEDDGLTPMEFFPRTIKLCVWSAHALNAWGLTGPGAPALLPKLRIRSGDPWVVSFASPQATLSDQRDELREFVHLLAPEVHQWAARVGLELNFSCPNTEHGIIGYGEIADHVCQCLDTAALLRIPIRCKFNALLDIAEARVIDQHPACWGFVMGNTIPWSEFPDQIPWHRFGSESPLKKRGFGPGGLSGPYLLPIHCDWIRKARSSGIKSYIWGCGGIMCRRDVDEYRKAGANAVQLGTVAIHRPWRMKGIIRHAHTVKVEPEFDVAPVL